MTTNDGGALARAEDGPPGVPAARGSRTRPGVRFILPAAAACAVVLLGWAATLAGPALGGTATAALWGLAVLATAGLTASGAWTAHHAEGRARRLWVVVTVSGVAWALAVPGVGSPASDESVGTDLLALAACGLAAVALLALVPRRVGPQRLRHLVGALVIAGCVFFLGVALAPDAVAVPADVGPLAAALSVARAIGDVVVVTLALVALSGSGRRPDLALALVVAGYCALAVADVGATAVVAGASDVATATVADAVRLAGVAALALAARAPDAVALFGERAVAAPERPGSTRSLLVYVPLLTAVVVIAGFTPRAGEMVLRVTEVTALLLFGLRQALIARESAQLHAQVEEQVDELRTTSASLARLASQNARTIEAVSEGIVGVDTGGRVTSANGAALAMLGRTLGALVGATPSETFLARAVDARGDASPNPVVDALASGAPAGPYSAVFRRADGSEFPGEWAAGPVAGDHGEPAGAVVVLRDITQRREVERMKDEFVSVLNHELRTPLTSIRGTLGLLDGGAVGPLTERAGSLVRHALDSSERLTRLVSDLLDVDRLELGANPLEFADADVEELVRAAVDGVRALAVDVPVEVRLGPVEGRVHGDADRIIQTLTNLLGNAIKFSPPRTTITVTAVGAGRFVEFVVADEGRGIPPEKVHRIFERFEQADSSDARLQGGTGLGLAISRSIVRRHGGSIWVESRLGIGSAFHFTIPAAGVPAGSGPRAWPSGPATPEAAAAVARAALVAASRTGDPQPAAGPVRTSG